MRRPAPLLCAVGLLFCPESVRAQDERRVSSPDGLIEFRIFVAQAGANGLPQLAYQVRRRGRTVIRTSFLGLRIYQQEPMLGENDGLVSSRTGEEGGRYRWLVAEYMQNGSLGRRINVEVRVTDEVVAFRYVIPPSTPLDEVLIEDELTEFDVAGRGTASEPAATTLAIKIEGGWVGLSEAPCAGFPPMALAVTADGIVVAHLSRASADARVAFAGRSPLLGPWRVVRFAGDRARALDAAPPGLLE